MILPSNYVFKYYPDYGGFRLCKLDPIKGNIIGYITNYGEYSKILKSKPELKKHYDSTDLGQRRKMMRAIEELRRHKYSYGNIVDQAMKLGVFTEDIQKLIENQGKLGLLPEKRTPNIIDLDNIEIKKPSSKSTMKSVSEYEDMRPEYLSLEERKKKMKKMKIKRKTNKCKCKK